MNTTRSRSAVLGLVCLTSTVAISSQILRDFNRPQTFDAQHYVIRASFDPATKRVMGETTIVVKPLKGNFRSLELDAVGIVFERATLESSGASLAFTPSVGKISVSLDRAYNAGESIAVRLKHSATPKKGIYFVEAAAGRSAQIWTQGEPDEARHWFPSFDFPSDKATTEQILTVARNETVIANGELIAKRDNADGTTTWHYNTPFPHSIYLVSFVIGQYVKLEDTYKNTPLGYYTYSGKEATARAAYRETAEMMRVFEDLTGVAFPYNKYDQTVVAKFNFGGMENITATTMADDSIFAIEQDFAKDSVTDLVSHELAHSWFGNLVTCRNWAELWLNESFATFMEAAYRERTRGRADYMASVREDAGTFLVNDSVNAKKHGLFNMRAGNVAGLFDNAAVTYNKGGAVLHTLREQVGDTAFWKAINIYLNRHRFGSVETPDLKRAMEETSGQNLAWFFNQWIYGGGSPRIALQHRYNTRTKSLTLSLRQTQVPDGLTPAVFRLPLDISIETSAGVQTERIEMKLRQQTFTFNVREGPSEVIVDKEEKIPVKRLTIR
ncbi:MAG: M1 family metallopeptidase [Pyrinomonadaceae bacterium]